mmetsp:Transcript_58083/g.141968  ORF Transcript_58083/g.141968 Transcript_58083/m.141968 type:complete len:497 (-) Transcript_58083:301-1791(-)
MSGGGGASDANKKCGLLELIVFVAAIIAGTACSILSKTMMGLQAEGITGEMETFEKPIFQTFGMFLGMTFGLVMHFVVLACKIPFPGYDHDDDTNNNTSTQSSDNNTKKFLVDSGAAPSEKTGLLKKVDEGKSSSDIDDVGGESTQIPVWMYFFLAIPAVFDLGATALCMMGLRYVNTSIYQLLRGSGIIFVAIMKQNILGDHLYKFQWVGVVWNVVSVILVGSTAILSEASGGGKGDDMDDSAADESNGSGNALLGVLLIMLGAFVQAMQFVFEEKVMTMDIPSPPLLLIGMEGLWGTIFCVLVVYPLVYYLPGSDHGSYEDPFNTWYMFTNSSTIQVFFWVYFLAIFGYNFFAVLVTYLLNSVWHAILDNFRPITVWMTSLFIFYVITPDFGEQWTIYSWVQVGGMCVLLYGTAIYNAPNSGSILLEGQWYACGCLDFSTEYEGIRHEEEEKALDEKWQQRMLNAKRGSSFFGAELSPHISVHTQALQGATLRS